MYFIGGSGGISMCLALGNQISSFWSDCIEIDVLDQELGSPAIVCAGGPNSTGLHVGATGWHVVVIASPSVCWGPISITALIDKVESIFPCDQSFSFDCGKFGTSGSTVEVDFLERFDIITSKVELPGITLANVISSVVSVQLDISVATEDVSSVGIFGHDKEWTIILSVIVERVVVEKIVRSSVDQFEVNWLIE